MLSWKVYLEFGSVFHLGGGGMADCGSLSKCYDSLVTLATRAFTSGSANVDLKFS